MKLKMKVVVGIIIVLTIFIPTVSKANMEIKGGKVTKWTKITISDAYDECKNLNSNESVLGTDQLDAHLVLNKDWGAVAYLAISDYGKVTENSTPSITIEGDNRHTTTTGNITGVIDFGKTYTFTSGINR